MARSLRPKASKGQGRPQRRTRHQYGALGLTPDPEVPKTARPFFTNSHLDLEGPVTAVLRISEKLQNEYTVGLQAFDTNLSMNDHTPDLRRGSSERHADAAITFLVERKADRPFFMYLAPPVPHDPRVAAPEFHVDVSGKRRAAAARVHAAASLRQRRDDRSATSSGADPLPVGRQDPALRPRRPIRTS